MTTRKMKIEVQAKYSFGEQARVIVCVTDEGKMLRRREFWWPKTLGERDLLVQLQVAYDETLKEALFGQ